MPRGVKQVKWECGSIFAVPLADGSFGLGQAVSLMMPHVVYCAMTSQRFAELPTDCPTIQADDVIPRLAVWRDALDAGEWPVICLSQPVIKKAGFPNERFAADGYVGAKHYDEGIGADLLSAYFGLIPWNGKWLNERYLDGLLAEGVRRPVAAVILDPEERRTYRLDRDLPL